MWDFLTLLLHGLAYFGVWVLNVIIYETILLVVWLMIGGFSRYVLHRSEARVDDIIRISGGILAIVMLAICVALCFNWITIVSYPTFG
jgi:hypothetical protein